MARHSTHGTQYYACIRYNTMETDYYIFRPVFRFSILYFPKRIRIRLSIFFSLHRLIPSATFMFRIRAFNPQL